ncbi:variant erythrocyte surface antigen-1 family protein [Babesia caballi]|uniref:Variant erythrocyte surface antigen-1 family protein n=1 Tax=Babesia caballi TaxID=5871 RepID=A0AAV4M0A6_BABCB|nr:variant erythrocyte surface antigen-1 family protein [Babesia caballi]
MHQEAIKALSNKVKELLKEVAKSDPNLGEDIKKIKDALSSDSGNNGLITKLAEGLQQFIGYNSSGKLTGGGILPANVAKHQVCNAVLNFVIRFLEGLCGIKASGHDKVSEVIRTLRNCVGTGEVPQGFMELVDGIKEKVQDIDTKLKQNQNKLHVAFQNFKTLVETLNYDQHSSTNVTQDSAKVKSFLDAVKNGIAQDGSSNFRNLCDKLKDLFGENKINMLWTSLSNNAQLNSSSLSNKTTSVTNYANDKGLTADINNLKYGMNAKPANAAVFTAVRDAATAFIAELQTKAYASYYDKAEWNNVSREDDKTKCAKIYLGCLPLYYQALSYIYWGCHDNGGGWKDQTLAGGAMRFYFDSQGFLSPYVDRSKTGAHVAESALKGFSELQAAASSLSTTESPYASFTTKLHDNAKQKLSNAATECPLSALYHGASYYFRCQQITNAKSAVGAPKTIREMLYFIAALQFSPQYDAFDGYVTEYFKAVTGNQSGGNDDSELKLQVAVSGSSKTGETLSAADLKSYLTSTFHLAPGALGVMQGPGGSQNNSEPWLHVLFCNSAFNFKYPRGASLFSLISNYAYALQFQVLFLYLMCSNYVSLCGWNNCTYGKEVKPNGSGTSSLKSHICPGLKCRDDPSKCNHKKGGGGTNCNHNNYDKTGGCGQSPNNSPLQAFLTDGIQGMCRQHPGSSYHLATCSGAMCHVPMGFAGNLRTDTKAGGNIYRSLIFFCARSTSPLRQLCENLGCLTKRTPRLLGDLFGFMWHLNSQLFKSGKSAEESVKDFMASIGFSNYSGSSQITPSTFLTYVTQKIKQLGSHSSSKAIEKALSLFSGLPFWYNIFMVKPDESLPAALFNLKGTDHKPSTYKNSLHNDLFSLYNPHCSNQSCGKYLMPLCFSNGATYSPKHAPSYLSWVLYLSDDLESGFEKLLDDFKNVDCSKTRCRKAATGGQQCQQNHHPGSHGTSSSCSCDSVVHCGGILPVLYRHRFQLYSPYSLSGGNNCTTKRSCDKFHDALSNVMTPNAPLTNLLTTKEYLESPQLPRESS